MITVVTNDIESFIDDIDIDEAIEEAIKTGNKYIKVNIEIPFKYDERYDEYYTKHADTVVIDIEKDLGITIQDLIDYCHFNCKEN